MGQRPKVNTASIFYDQKCTSLKFRKKKKKSFSTQTYNSFENSIACVNTGAWSGQWISQNRERIL